MSTNDGSKMAKAMLSSAILLTTVLILQQQQVVFGDSYYRRLNGFLTKRVGTEDPKANILRATKELREIRRGHAIENNPFECSLGLFVSLADLIDQNKCNMDGYKILFNNIKEAGGIELFKSEDFRQPRLHHIILYYARRHAYNCRQIYRIKFDKVYDQMDVDMVRKVETLMDKIATNLYITSKPSESLVEALKVAEMPDEDLVKATKRALISSPDSVELQTYLNSKGLTKEIEEANLETMLDKHLFSPCRYFIEQLEPILKPAEYALAIGGSPKIATSEDVQRMQPAIIQYRLCSMFTSKVDRKSFINDIIRS